MAKTYFRFLTTRGKKSTIVHTQVDCRYVVAMNNKGIGGDVHDKKPAHTTVCDNCQRLAKAKK